MSDNEIFELFKDGVDPKKIARQAKRPYLEIKDLLDEYQNRVITDVEVLEGETANLSSLDQFSNELESTARFLLGRIKSAASTPEVTPKELSSLSTSVTQLKSAFFAKDTNINIGAVINADKLQMFKGMLSD